tara:strand:- start:1954 stop:2793 length:840 start_codon:yes stop_codon:yes gene_type:complete
MSLDNRELSYPNSLKILLEIVDTYKEEIPDGTYIKICQGLKERFQGGASIINNDSDSEIRYIDVLRDDKIDSSLSPLYQYLILCVLEQRGPNSISGTVKSEEKLKESDTQYRDHKKLLLHYIDSVSDSFYFLNRMKCDIDTLTTIQTRDCQTFQTGNHYSNLVFRTYHKESQTFYNLSFKAKFKQNTHPDYNIYGDKMINVSYSTDLVIDKKKPDRPYSNHIIGVDDDTLYHRTNIYTTSIYHNNSQIMSLPGQYLIRDLLSPDYIIDIKKSPDTCIIS